MSHSEDGRDVFKLTPDWLSVQEVVDAVGSSSCGAVSVFIGPSCIDQSKLLQKTVTELDGLHVVSDRNDP